MLFHILYWIILTTFGLFNLWLVKQNYHRSFNFGGSLFTSSLYDEYSFQLNSINISLWILILILGIYWSVYWWLTPIIFILSYIDGRRRAIRREYKVLKDLELSGKLKDLNGNSMTAEEEVVRLLEFRRKKLSGFYNN